MKRILITLAAAVPMAGGSLWAANGQKADTTAYNNLKEVEVLATRATATTPVAFTNLSNEQLTENNDGLDIPYLLLSTPSVITTSDAGAGVGYTSLRVRGTDGSRINVTANGVPVNNPESHVVFWVNTPDLASSLADVQIQRGAGTSTNGAGAFGASVNMRTLGLRYQPQARVDAAYGMYNTRKITAMASSGLMNDHWALDLRLSNIGSDGYIDRAWSKLWSYQGQLGYYNRGTAIKLLAFGGKEQTYMAWDYASKEQMAEFGRRYNPCGEYTDDAGNTAYYPDQTDNYIQHNFQLIYNQALGRDWKLNATIFYVKGDGYYQQYKTRRTLIEYGLQPFELDGEMVEKSDLVRLKKMDNGFGGGVFSVNYLSSRVNATVGGGLNNYRGHHFGQLLWVRNYVGPINPLQEYYRNLGDKFDANIYARADAQIAKGLTAYADLQYRHIKYSITGHSDTYDWNTEGMQLLDIHRTFNFFNPKAGLNYQPSRAHRVFASWSVAHREPTRDNFIDCAPSRPPRAERLFDYELGYNFTSRIFSAGLNLYCMDYDDQLVPTGQLSDTGNAVSVNVPSSYRLGAELTLALKPVKWFSWDFTCTWSRNRVKDFTEYIYEDEWTNPITFDRGDTPIAFSPDFTLHNAFNFTWRGFDAKLASQYVSKQYLTNSGDKDMVIDPYFVTDLHLGYTFKHIAAIKELRVGLNIYNLFSEEYENNGYAGAGYYLEDGKPVIYRYSGYAAQAPIHLMGTVSVKF